MHREKKIYCVAFSLKSVADLLVFFQQYVMYIFIYICDQMVAKYLVTDIWANKCLPCLEREIVLERV